MTLQDTALIRQADQLHAHKIAVGESLDDLNDWIASLVDITQFNLSVEGYVIQLNEDDTFAFYDFMFGGYSGSYTIEDWFITSDTGAFAILAEDFERRFYVEPS